MLSKITGLEAQTTFWHARHNARLMHFVGSLRDRLFGDDDTRGDSEEGVMQGAPDSPAVYCVATRGDTGRTRLPRQCGGNGGGHSARAYMDDVAVVATPHTGFMAIAEYIKNIKTTAGVRIEKVENTTSVGLSPHSRWNATSENCFKATQHNGTSAVVRTLRREGARAHALWQSSGTWRHQISHDGAHVLAAMGCCLQMQHTAFCVAARLTGLCRTWLLAAHAMHTIAAVIQASVGRHQAR